jgi:hypothetical protein
MNSKTKGIDVFIEALGSLNKKLREGEPPGIGFFHGPCRAQGGPGKISMTCILPINLNDPDNDSFH